MWLVVVGCGSRHKLGIVEAALIDATVCLDLVDRFCVGLCTVRLDDDDDDGGVGQTFIKRRPKR